EPTKVGGKDDEGSSEQSSEGTKQQAASTEQRTEETAGNQSAAAQSTQPAQQPAQPQQSQSQQPTQSQSSAQPRSNLFGGDGGTMGGVSVPTRSSGGYPTYTGMSTGRPASASGRVFPADDDSDDDVDIPPFMRR